MLFTLENVNIYLNIQPLTSAHSHCWRQLLYYAFLYLTLTIDEEKTDYYASFLLIIYLIRLIILFCGINLNIHSILLLEKLINWTKE